MSLGPRWKFQVRCDRDHVLCLYRVLRDARPVGERLGVVLPSVRVRTHPGSRTPWVERNETQVRVTVHRTRVPRTTVPPTDLSLKPLWVYGLRLHGPAVPLRGPVSRLRVRDGDVLTGTGGVRARVRRSSSVIHRFYYRLTFQWSEVRSWLSSVSPLGHSGVFGKPSINNWMNFTFFNLLCDDLPDVPKEKQTSDRSTTHWRCMDTRGHKWRRIYEGKNTLSVEVHDLRGIHKR